MRLFRSSEASIQLTAAQALVRFAERSSRADTVVRCLLQIITTQGDKVSSNVVTAIRNVIVTVSLSDVDSERCVAALAALLGHPRPAMQMLAAQTIASALLVSSRPRLASVVEERTLFVGDSPHTAIIILNELLRSTSPAVIEVVLPFAREMVEVFEKCSAIEVQKWFPVMVATMILDDPELIVDLLPRLDAVASGGTIQAQVVACKEFSRLQTAETAS
jgi:hypothetical protein